MGSESPVQRARPGSAAKAPISSQHTAWHTAWHTARHTA